MLTRYHFRRTRWMGGKCSRFQFNKKTLVQLKSNKEEIIRVGKKARETARKIPWEMYQDEIVELINKVWRESNASTN